MVVLVVVVEVVVVVVEVVVVVVEVVVLVVVVSISSLTSLSPSIISFAMLSKSKVFVSEQETRLFLELTLCITFF